MAKQVNAVTVDNESGTVICQSMEHYTITDGKEKLTPYHVFGEAKDAQQAKDEFDRQENTFAKHFVMLAAKCEKLEVFEALCARMEHELKWGKAPKGTPKHELTAWQGRPGVYGVYKSYITKAWEAGIKPMGQFSYTQKLPRATKDGVTEKEVSKAASTPQLMNKARGLLDKATEPKASKPKAGVIVGKKGQEHRHASPATQGLVDASRTMAGIIDPVFAGLLSDLVDAYSVTTDDGRRKCQERMKRLIKDLNKVAPKAQAVAAKVAKG